MTTKKMKELILLSTAIATALIAGLFYAYTCSVNTGLGRLPGRDYLAAMQAINRAILNPLFFASFMGALLLLPVSAWLNFNDDTRLRFTLLCAAAILYLAGVFGVTIFGNVPLNDVLARIDLKSLSPAQVAEQRNAFEKPWLIYHNVRTVAAVICLALVILSCMFKKMPA
ncbi:MAG: anthrone oxygenase family protein [Bacteroidota bacterium]